MKRVLISLCVTSLFSMQAYAQATTPDKKVSTKTATAPVAETTKVKKRSLSRDQLRRCIVADRENKAASEAIAADEAKFAPEFDVVKAEEDALRKKAEALGDEGNANKAEREVLAATAKELSVPVEGKAKLKELKAKRDAFNLKIDAFTKRNEANKEAWKVQDEAQAQLLVRSEATIATKKKLKSRQEDLNLGIDSWTADCENRPYAERDHAAIVKELDQKK